MALTRPLLLSTGETIHNWSPPLLNNNHPSPCLLHLDALRSSVPTSDWRPGIFHFDLSLCPRMIRPGTYVVCAELVLPSSKSFQPDLAMCWTDLEASHNTTSPRSASHFHKPVDFSSGIPINQEAWGPLRIQQVLSRSEACNKGL